MDKAYPGASAKGIESRLRMLAAAEDLHARKPAASIRIAEIAALAGVSPALVIAHFKSKDELLFAAYLKWIEVKVVPEADAFVAANPHATAADILCKYFSLVSSPLHRARDLMATSYWWTAPEGARYRQSIVPLQMHIRAALRRVCPNAIEDRIAAAEMLIESAFEAILRRAGVDSLPPAQIKELLEAACRTTLTGLRDRGD